VVIWTGDSGSTSDMSCMSNKVEGKSRPSSLLDLRDEDSVVGDALMRSILVTN